MATVQDLLDQVRTVEGVISANIVQVNDLIDKYNRKDYFCSVTYLDPNDSSRVVVENFVIYEFFDDDGNSIGAYFGNKPSILFSQTTQTQNALQITIEEITQKLEDEGISVQGAMITEQAITSTYATAEVVVYVLDTESNVVIKKNYFFKKTEEGIEYYEIEQ